MRALSLEVEPMSKRKWRVLVLTVGDCMDFANAAEPMTKKQAFEFAKQWRDPAMNCYPAIIPEESFGLINDHVLNDTQIQEQVDRLAAAICGEGGAS